MKFKQLFALTALTLAADAVLADEAPGAPLTRAEVRQSVLAARANGTLPHAGEVGDQMTPYKPELAAPSGVMRAEVKADVLQARAAGTLAPAGTVAPEDDREYAQAHPSTSTLTRAEVKADVLEARSEGALIPAGAGQYPDLPAQYTHHVAAKSGQTVASHSAESHSAE